jgi:hypothetical protein
VITDIVLTSEMQKDKPLQSGDLTTDVIVHFDNGDRYVATFYSYKCLNEMLETDMKSAAFFAKDYYRILDMVLVKDFNNGDLYSLIETMIAEGDFQLVFRKV